MSAIFLPELAARLRALTGCTLGANLRDTSGVLLAACRLRE